MPALRMVWLCNLSAFLRPVVVAQAAQAASGDTVAKLHLNSVALAALQATEAGYKESRPM